MEHPRGGRDIVYQVDPRLFRDADGHGVGTLDGIRHKLSHISSLGVTILWLLPFYPSGGRDGGYDVTDHCEVDPILGTSESFRRLVQAARRHGIRIMIELVMQHTSALHEWFKESRLPGSMKRDWYVWTDDPTTPSHSPMFPPIEPGIWSWDVSAGKYYRHHFYSHEPDLEIANADVRSAVWTVMKYWIDQGVSGFRVDAAPYMVERAACSDEREDGLWLLEEMFEKCHEIDRPLLLGEADVEASEYQKYLKPGRLSHLLDFQLNNAYFLALARQDASELIVTLRAYGQ